MALWSGSFLGFLSLAASNRNSETVELRILRFLRGGVRSAAGIFVAG
jgi:hypothetical protein